MAVKGTLIIMLVVIMFISQNVSGFPRDDTFVAIEDVQGNENSSPKIKLDVSAHDTSSTEIPSQGIHRVACDNQDEEPIEDFMCQEHCLPKGYSYGLCVSKTCTCV
ncbi:uncharacterized protein LOC135309759 [Plodia interpunctella]|uniref:uncharacterized protein LOC135309759 n=1 Tax=Plodia interpunctella TaxID=58824 RepID=UPI003101AEBE